MASLELNNATISELLVAGCYLSMGRFGLNSGNQYSYKNCIDRCILNTSRIFELDNSNEYSANADRVQLLCSDCGLRIN